LEIDNVFEVFRFREHACTVNRV